MTLLKETQNALVIEVTECVPRIIAKFVGTSANEDADFLKRYFK
jgi:hypothetical protein